MRHPLPMATVPSLPPYLNWGSQVRQYPATGDPGISYFRGDVGDGKWVDCLLWRDELGTLRGILNYFPFDFPPMERKGNVMLLVESGWRGRGIATALLDEAVERWGVDFSQQDYTPEGAAMARAYLAKKEARDG